MSHGTSEQLYDITVMQKGTTARASRLAALPRAGKGGYVDERNRLAALGIRIRLLRIARGKSQAEVASAAGMHRTVLGRIERGEVNFGIDYLWRLADVFGASVSELLPDDDDIYQSMRDADPGTAHGTSKPS
jgi:DNA-binding XRE family transcriptional regulator